MRTPLAIALLIAFLSGAAPAQLPGPDEQIRIRQGGKLYVAWHLKRIGDLVASRSAFDQDAVFRSAQVVAAFANSGWGSLYGPGTEKLAGEGKPRIKAEFFLEAEKVRDIGKSLSTETAELLRQAEIGDPAAIRQQLARTNEVCRSCHERYRGKA